MDSLLDVEETAFKQSLNDRIRGIWTRGKWPPLLTVTEKAVAAVGNYDKAVRIDNLTDLFDVFGIFEKNPLQDKTAVKIEHKLIDGYVVLPADSSVNSIFIFGTKVPDEYGDGTNGTQSSIPEFMSRMLLAYCLSDYYRSDGQHDKAFAEEQRGEEYLIQEFDRYERMGSQNTITINSYPTYYSSLLVRQNNI